MGENCVFVTGVFVDGIILCTQGLVSLGDMVRLRAHSKGPVYGSRAYQPKHTGGFTDEFFIMKIHNCLCNGSPAHTRVSGTEVRDRGQRSRQRGLY